MKVEFSSWETTDSSLTRRRKCSSKKQEKNSSMDCQPFVAHSMVSQQRARTSKKARGIDDLIPLLALTNETKVAVVGILKGELTISQNRQFPAAPGTKFLPSDGAFSVPAVLERRTDLIFCMQRENTRLLCWPSVSDSQDHIVSKSLPGVAVSLEVMPTKFSFVFGTLLQSRGDEKYGNVNDDECSPAYLYLASLDKGEGEINLKTFPLNLKELSSDPKLQHVLTMGNVIEGEDNFATSSARTSGSKRKANAQSGDDHEILLLSQVFFSQHTLYIVHHQFRGKDNSDLASLERHQTNVHKVPLENLHRHEATAITAVGAQNNILVLSCRTASSSQFIVSLSAQTGRVLKGPFEIDASVHHLSIVDTHLAMGQINDGIVLIDTASGVVLQKTALPQQIRSGPWHLLGLDWKRSRIFVLLEHSDRYSVASANVSFKGEGDALSPTCLAARLCLSMESRPSAHQGAVLRRQRLQDRDGGDGGYSAANTTKKGLEMLDMACAALESTSKIEKDFVPSAFARVLETITRADKFVSLPLDGDENPQDCHLSKKHNQTRKNGMVKSMIEANKNIPVQNGGKTANMSPNGNAEEAKFALLRISKHLRNIDPDLVSNIGVAAIRIMLVNRDIGTARNIARSILRKVVRSNRSSARCLFDSFGNVSLSDILESMQRCGKGESVAYSPVELLFDMCSHCKDVSERHMVVGAHYMLVHATADEIADYFERTQPLSPDNTYRLLCDEYKSRKNGPNLVEGNETLESCSSKLLLRGSEAFISQLLTYSDCNETLLRRAIAENLSRTEVCVFLKVVTHVRDVVQTFIFNSSVLERIFTWMSALLERLRPPQNETETSVLRNIKKLLAREIKSAFTIREIKGLLENTIAEIKEATDSAQGARAQGGSQLPPYQLERLVF